MLSLLRRSSNVANNEQVKGFVDTTFPQLIELPEEQQNEALKLLNEKLFSKRSQDIEERQRQADEVLEEGQRKAKELIEVNNRIKKLSAELS